MAIVVQFPQKPKSTANTLMQRMIQDCIRDAAKYDPAKDVAFQRLLHALKP
ncbi:hypothetical protein [Tumebacillus permanentifrigoris]|uniref:Uncharacterized protein n=1 Tax=Tumebacillus permanentifrigoris TaxID=378543 RepID=A0A316DXY1_9BACL|nr:hypothetical protein [Tumebacillus permanentifrigoris]PWK14971.1 hypothetical protein C7459_104175 [Tumebacillus permanentifrigoris]